MKTSLGQYCINVSDLERSVAFYEGVLGLPVQSRTDIPGVNEVIVGADDGGGRLQLAHHFERDDPIDHGNALWKLYVNTDDCEGLFWRAIEGGARSVSAPQRLERWPVTIAFILDPDGYTIELVQRDPG